jgi:amino acid transporter
VNDPDEQVLNRLGYAQVLLRRLGGFSNFAISLSIICILAGGVTSFHQGLCSVGGASIGLGWPLGCLFALAVAATMGQVASAFPTAGGLYHWAAVLGGRGWGWVTAWFNLLGLITVLAAINVGAWRFAASGLAAFGVWDVKSLTPAGQVAAQLAAVLAVTFGQGLFNHLGIRATSRLTDFSGYWILFVAAALTAALLLFAASLDLGRLVTFDNLSGLPEGDDQVWPHADSLAYLFALGLLLPMYTLTGYDASAHVAEETHAAGRTVPRAMVRAVLVSGLFGWLMLAAVVLATPNLREAAGRGGDAFVGILNDVLPRWLALTLFAGILLAQFLCGLATVTSASRMAFAFARDGGLPWSRALRWVSPGRRSPAVAVWTVAAASVVFTVYTPVYDTITAVCTLFLYVSYVLPTALGLWAFGRTWTHVGPWHLGRWYRPLAAVAVLGCGALLLIGVQPPNEKALLILAGTLALLAAGWFAYARRHFPGPTVELLRSESEPDPRSVRARSVSDG